METRNVVLDTMQLDNGLTVHFIDLSRPIAGDRAQARLLIRVPLEVKEEHFADYPDPLGAFEDFVSLCPAARFEVEKVRNFVGREQLGEMLDRMKDDFIQTGLRYLERPKFVQGWISGRYEQLRRERATREAHEQVMRTVGE